jgi:hypothetical protein
MARDIIDEREVRYALLCVERANRASEDTRRAVERSQQVLQQSLKALGLSTPEERDQTGSVSGGKLEQ